MTGPDDTTQDSAEKDSATAADEEPVEIVDYDPSWPAEFAAEAARILLALSGDVLGIEHVGSTAVEGLAAKAVIDIQVGVRTLTATPRIVEAMRRLGYIYVPELEDDLPNRRYFRRSAHGRRTHQVHLVERSDRDWWDRHTAFRDWLRAHPDDATAYAGIKRELANAYRNDRRAYSEAKTNFVNAILAKCCAVDLNG